MANRWRTLPVTAAFELQLHEVPGKLGRGGRAVGTGGGFGRHAEVERSALPLLDGAGSAAAEAAVADLRMNFEGAELGIDDAGERRLFPFDHVDADAAGAADDADFRARGFRSHRC